jgi:hypothetical protein
MDFYRNMVGSCGVDSSGLELGLVAGSCGNGNEHSYSVKDVKLLD